MEVKPKWEYEKNLNIYVIFITVIAIFFVLAFGYQLKEKSDLIKNHEKETEDIRNANIQLELQNNALEIQVSELAKENEELKSK